MLRIGHGFDVHALLDKNLFIKSYPERKEHKFIMGGVEIPFEKVLLGHSDADVLTHAICDALLGAAGFKDIGNQFPDTDHEYRGIDSQKLLKKVLELISEKFSIVNIDSTILAERPKFAPYIQAMRIKLAETLSVNIDQINIKATTTEKLGFTGREEGIAAEAVCLLSMSWDCSQTPISAFSSPS